VQKPLPNSTSSPTQLMSILEKTAKEGGRETTKVLRMNLAQEAIKKREGLLNKFEVHLFHIIP